MNRRRFGTALGAVAIGWAGLARTQGTFPSAPIRLICPWPPGGGADTQMRALADAASRVLGQRVVIENRPGAVGTLGPGLLVGAKPDGYVLSQGTNGLFRQPFITKTPYDPAKDFTYVIGITGFSFGLAVRADAPWRTLAEFVDHAKANPGKVKYGTFGVGSPPHIVMDQIAARNGIDWTHVPMKGTAENITQLLGGHLDAISEGTGWGPHVDAGKMRVLAVFGAGRLRRWPNVPTLKELGYEIADQSPWGIIGPAGMPADVVGVIHDAFRKAMDDPKFLSVLDTLGQEPAYMSPDEYRQFAMRMIPIQKAIVDKYNLKLN